MRAINPQALSFCRSRAQRSTPACSLTLRRTFSSTNEAKKMEEAYTKLLEGNKKFADELKAKNPLLLQTLAKGQKPQTLWIGCSDSRVPANTITSTLPGEIFVHRNIANTVVHTDVNLLSVLQYAVDVLEVKHIVVCGHLGCGGVIASMTNKHFGMVDNWLRNLKDEYLLYRDELEKITDHKERANKFTEYHVKEGVLSICRTSIVQDAWERRKGGLVFPHVHGWVYGLEEARVHDLKVTIKGPQDLPLIVRNPIDPAKAV